MSQADVKRFVDDLKTKPKLVAGLKGKATGIAAVAAFAAANGYAVTADEVRAYIRSHSLKNLSDAHIDHIAGGKTQGPIPAQSLTDPQDVSMVVVVVGPVALQGQIASIAALQMAATVTVA